MSAHFRAAPNAGALILGAAVTLVLCVVLGLFVSGHEPGALDRAAAGLFFGQAVQLAAALTAAGRFPAYAFVSVAGLLLGAWRRDLLPRAVVAVVSLVAVWLTSDLFKVLYHRPRPIHWLVYYETSPAYPSGHAANVVAFWGVWLGAALAVRSRAWRLVLVGAMVLWMLGIGWSRLALGAHYLTDVAGGYLMGLSFALIAAAVLASLQPGIRRPPPKTKVAVRP